MPVVPSRQSVDCKVCETYEEARQHGKGAIKYIYKEGSASNFPDDVEYVYIKMPIDWRLDDGEDKEVCAEYQQCGVGISWDVKHNDKGRWILSGTYEKPTLSPSLHWIGVWHGHLVDGHLRSCD